MSLSVCVRGQLVARLCSVRNGAAGCSALLSAAALRGSAVRPVLSEPLPVFPDHGEMYASEPGDGAGGLSADHHPVSTFSRRRAARSASLRRGRPEPRSELVLVRVEGDLCTPSRAAAGSGGSESAGKALLGSPSWRTGKFSGHRRLSSGIRWICEVTGSLQVFETGPTKLL